MQRFFINQLPKDIIDKISISFLIKYPACVLKELIENSLDANSSNVSVHIEEYGVKLIKVIDNGVGVYKNDLNKLGLRFNTSKILKIDDLNYIKTYGFRGESLYAIRALSKLNIISKPYDQDFAYNINFSDTNSSPKISIVPGINGTTVEVKDLFYKNFELKTLAKNFFEEKNSINYVLACMALSRFDVRFVFYSNGIELCNFPVCNNINSRFNRLLFFYSGLKIDNIIDLNYSLDDVHFYGFIYFNVLKKKNDKFKFFFVNNRIVNSDIIDKICNDIFYNKNEKNNISYCFYLYLDPSLYTVLFSINKMDVSFKNYAFIYKFLFDAISKSIKLNEFKYSDNLYKKNDLESNLDLESSHFFRMSRNVNKFFENNNGVIIVCNDLNVCFYLKNKLYFIYLPVIRNRVLINLFSNQYIKHSRILNKKILYCELLSLETFSIFLEFKNILLSYGFVFEIFDDKFLLLKHIPVLLYNLDINWNKLFLDLKFFFERSIFSSFSFNRFDINIINIYIKNIYPKSKVYTYEVYFFNRELIFSSINDISWFNKNCNEVFFKRK